MQQTKAIYDNGLFIGQQHNTTPKGVLKQQNQPISQQQYKQKSLLKDDEEGENPFIDDLTIELSGPGQDLPTSVQCTREVSPQSCSFNDEDKVRLEENESGFKYRITEPRVALHSIHIG